MSVPVYLFTGFLESGKTSLIKDTLMDQGFNTGEKTAILLCEEGMEEYDDDFLKKTNSVVIPVENEDDLNYPLMRICAANEEPDRIFIEFNGTWNLNDFLDRIEMPMDWILVQILSTVDASTFEMYTNNNNMKSMIYEQLKHSEVVIFNRCDASTRKLYLRNNIKAFNKVAQVIYEDMQGNVSGLESCDLPFDMNAKVIEISDDDYGLWYMDAMENPRKYKDKKIIIKARVETNVVKGIPRAFIMGRYAMVCCAEDTSLIGLLVHYPKASQFIKGDWVKVEAKIKLAYDEQYGHEVVVLYAKKVELCEGLEDDYVYFT